jgi:PIN domain nuclease of toxin-antitoxin system
MKLLLDTQCWIWLQSFMDRFTPAARELVQDPTAELVFSAACAWEIAIKQGLGKLELPEPALQYVTSRMETSGAIALPITHLHALQVATLPMHHRDPFDRILIAQAMVEGLDVLTADRQFAPYDVRLRWAR